MTFRLKTEENISNVCSEIWPRGEEFNYINLVSWIGQLKSDGYFYNREWTCIDEMNGARSLWQSDTEWLNEVISEEWLEKPLEELTMEFVHILTGEKRYLHVTWESYGYKEGGEPRVFVNRRQFVRNGNIFVANAGKPCFEKLLRDGDAYAVSNVFRQIDETALRWGTESFFSAFCKNGYRQTKVAKRTVDCEKETRLYWAGEFVKEPMHGEYVYLIRIQRDMKSGADVKGGRAAGYCFCPVLYIMKTREPITEICLENGDNIKLQDMLWLNRPFRNYYDLPEEDLCVIRGEEWVMKEGSVNSGSFQDFLKKLKKEGYEYRREQVWEAGDVEKEEMEIIKAQSGFEPEYLECGLAKIQMEFVNPETGERMYIVVDPEKKVLYRDNGSREENVATLNTAYFRADRSLRARYYGEEKMSPYMEELILPEPVCLKWLKEYELISEDQIKICHLSGQPEFQEWFDMTAAIPQFVEEGELEESLDGEQRQEDAKSAREDEELRWAEEAARADEELRQAEESKARRIARGLKYGLLEECEVNGRKVEIYANGQRSRALYLIDNGRTCDVRYVDKYMDVNAALS